MHVKGVDIETVDMCVYEALVRTLRLHYVTTYHSPPCGPGRGIATGYGLDGLGIESRWGRDFPHLSKPVLGPTQPPVQFVPGFSRGKRAAGA
jgi:hypothetical protein